MNNQRKPHSWIKTVRERYWGLPETKRRDMLEFMQRKWSTADQAANRNSDLLRDIASYEQNYLLALLKSAPGGISDAEAVARLREHGFNEVAHEQPTGWPRQLLRAFNNPFNILLIVLAVISYITDDLKATIILSVMVALSSLLRFVQEFRSGNAAERLKAMVLTTATVKRVDDLQIAATEYADKVGIVRQATVAATREIPIKYLVPGDIVRLSAGDMIPADVRLLSAKDLFISQGALTGEAYPVEKTAESVTVRIDNPLEIANLCFMGSNVVSGSATAVVVTTGFHTYFGGISHKIVGHREPTAFDKGIHRVSWLLIRFMLVMVPIVFLVNGFTKHDWGEAFLFAIAVAVGLTPEMLPMIVTAFQGSRHNHVGRRFGEIAGIVGPEDRPHRLFRGGLIDDFMMMAARRAKTDGLDAARAVDRLIGLTDFRACLFHRQFVQVHMMIRVIAHLVTFARDPRDHGRRFVHLFSNQKEGGFHILALQKIEQTGRERGMRAVVESEGDLTPRLCASPQTDQMPSLPAVDRFTPQYPQQRPLRARRGSRNPLRRVIILSRGLGDGIRHGEGDHQPQYCPPHQDRSASTPHRPSSQAIAPGAPF